MSSAATGMQPEFLILSEREEQVPYDITYMWNLKYGTNELFLQNRNRLTDTENRLVVVKGGRGKGLGRTGSLGLADRRKLLHLEWISDEVLLYSIGNYIHDEK